MAKNKTSSDSDSDSDYNPAEDKNDDHDEIDDNIAELTTMNRTQKRKVDNLWDELKASDEQEVAAKMGKSLVVKSNTEKKKKKKEKISPALRDMYSSIFGSSMKIQRKADKGSNEGEIDLKEEARKAAKLVSKKQKVTEVRKFAGQTITVEKTVHASSSQLQARTLGEEKREGIDKVIDSIKGPKTLSTVTKSNADWDNFKEKEGLDDTLAAAAKDGYLTKKEFLNRCDVRSFENERDERLRKAAK